MEGWRERRCTHAAVPALGVGVVADDAGIALLEIFGLGRLDCHVDLGAEADGGRRLAQVGALALARAVGAGLAHGDVWMGDVGWDCVAWIASRKVRCGCLAG